MSDWALCIIPAEGGSFSRRSPGKSVVSDRTVTCTVMITNKIDDRELQISGEARIYDDFGNEYQPHTVQIANTKLEIQEDYYVAEKILISGVPTKTIFTFQKVSPEATMIASFKISFSLPKWK